MVSGVASLLKSGRFYFINELSKLLKTEESQSLIKSGLFLPLSCLRRMMKKLMVASLLNQELFLQPNYKDLDAET